MAPATDLNVPNIPYEWQNISKFEHDNFETSCYRSSVPRNAEKYQSVHSSRSRPSNDFFHYSLHDETIAIRLVGIFNTLYKSWNEISY